MAEPITLTVVGTIALTEGIKFLYTQAGEVLKRCRERRTTHDSVAATDQAVPIEVQLPDIFTGQLTAPKLHFDVVTPLEGELRELRKSLSDYAEGIEPVDIHNADLLREVDALRQVLEAVFQQQITFKGEQRAVSGPLVEGHIDVQQVAGYVAAVRAQKIARGTVVAGAKAARVDAGGQLIGIDVDTVGGHSA